MDTDKIRVLMCCSDIRTVKGGMVSVMKSYLEAACDWKRVEVRYIPTHTEGGKLRKSICFLIAYCRIFRLLFMRKVDILHLHISERGSFYRKAYLVRLGKFFAVPVILHHHGAEFENFYAGLSGKKKRYVDRIFTMADLNLVLSRNLMEPLKEKAPGAKVEVLYNSVPVPERNLYTNERQGLLILGRLGKRKGTWDLLEAASALKEELPEGAKLYLCGDGETQEAARRVEELELKERTAFIGWVSGEEKDRILRMASMHILPSYMERLPMSILETMAYGIPNIATNIASVPEVIVDGKNGRLIAPGDGKALRDAILELAGDSEKRRFYSENAYRTIQEKFSLKAHMEKLEEMYGRLKGE